MILDLLEVGISALSSGTFCDDVDVLCRGCLVRCPLATGGG